VSFMATVGMGENALAAANPNFVAARNAASKKRRDDYQSSVLDAVADATAPMSLADVAAKIGRDKTSSRNTIAMHLNELVEAGLIERFDRPHAKASYTYIPVGWTPPAVVEVPPLPDLNSTSKRLSSAVQKTGIDAARRISQPFTASELANVTGWSTSTINTLLRERTDAFTKVGKNGRQDLYSAFGALHAVSAPLPGADGKSIIVGEGGYLSVPGQITSSSNSFETAHAVTDADIVKQLRARLTDTDKKLAKFDSLQREREKILAALAVFES